MNAAVKKAAEGPFQGIIEYSEEALVSKDMGTSVSTVFNHAAADQSDRQPGQGHRVVRQRVGCTIRLVNSCPTWPISSENRPVSGAGAPGCRRHCRQQAFTTGEVHCRGCGSPRPGALD
ncbi:hypothetical protein QJS66_02875 [Kocuria rhizophila]|nr:hypothetical protein QJS66_02875 [Kocuria rhizophila]